MAWPAADATGAREPSLWLFNLDAELELAKRGSYQTPRRVARSFEPVLAHARRLMAPGDAWLEGTQAPAGAWSGRVGRAWCPTPSALRLLAKAGARLEASPPVEVLRRVNHRRFGLELGGCAPGARYVESADDLALSLREASVRPWLFKKPFGFAGRGQRRIAGEPSKDDRRWLGDGMRQGGLLAEPWLDIARELSVHGVLDAEGRCTFGRVCVQQTNRFRAWVSTELAGPADLDASQARVLLSRAQAVAEALAQAGYFGPFGIDAYLWRSASGALELNPQGELNARYTMGFCIGMAATGPTAT